MQLTNGNTCVGALSIDRPIGQPDGSYGCYLDAFCLSSPQPAGKYRGQTIYRAPERAQRSAGEGAREQELSMGGAGCRSFYRGRYAVVTSKHRMRSVRLLLDGDQTPDQNPDSDTDA